MGNCYMSNAVSNSAVSDRDPVAPEKISNKIDMNIFSKQITNLELKAENDKELMKGTSYFLARIGLAIKCFIRKMDSCKNHKENLYRGVLNDIASFFIRKSFLKRTGRAIKCLIRKTERCKQSQEIFYRGVLDNIASSFLKDAIIFNS